MVFEGETVTVEDDRFNYGEIRFITLGLLESRVVVVVHTERENKIRIISVRKATKNERTEYFQQIALGFVKIQGFRDQIYLVSTLCALCVSVVKILHLFKCWVTREHTPTYIFYVGNLRSLTSVLYFRMAPLIISHRFV